MSTIGKGPLFETELHLALKSKDVARALMVIDDDRTWYGKQPMGILCTANDRRTALHYAAWFSPRRADLSMAPEDPRWWQVYEKLADRAKAVINARDRRQHTALIVACAGGNVAMARTLLQAGANPNVSVDSQGGYGHEGPIQRTSNVKKNVIQRFGL